MSSPSYSSEQVGIVDLYVAVDALTAADTNTGLSPSVPIKTLDEVIRRVNRYRQIAYRVIVHFASGVYTWSETLGPVPLRDDIIFVGDGAGQAGDDGFTQLTTGACDGSSTTSLIVTSGLGVDAYMSKTVEIVATGDRRSIRNHTDTGLVPSAWFTVAPTGTYRILEPAVIFQRVPFTLASVPSGPTIFGVGSSGHFSAQYRNHTLVPALYLANVRCTGPTVGSFSVIPWDIVDSTVVLCGIELIEATSQFQLFSGCSRSTVRAGQDYNVSGIQLVGPYKAGLVANTTQWRGWGLTQPAIGSTQSTIEIMYLSGYVSLVNPTVTGGEWWLFGGAIVEATSGVVSGNSSLNVNGGAKVTLGDWLPTRQGTPYLVRHSTADIRSSCIRAGHGVTTLLHALIEKTNTGLGVQAVGADDHQSTAPGVLSIAGDGILVNINAIVGSSTPSYGMFVRGGGRINFHDAYMAMSGWTAGTETALGSRRLDQSSPDSTHALTDYTYDGQSFASLDGSVIERF